MEAFGLCHYIGNCDAFVLNNADTVKKSVLTHAPIMYAHRTVLASVGSMGPMDPPGVEV